MLLCKCQNAIFNMKKHTSNISLALSHIREWCQAAQLGERRVILRTPLNSEDRILLEKCRKIGQIHYQDNRYMIERIY